MIHSTLNLFPNIEDKEGLQTELVKIRDRGAERNWSRSEYYRHRQKPQSEAIYLECILKDFPDSVWAEKAANRLKELGPKSLDTPKSSQAAPQDPAKSKPQTPARAPVGPQFPKKRSPKSAPPAKIPADGEFPAAEPNSSEPGDP